MICRVLPLAFLASLIAAPAAPCSFHGYVPQETFVEKLLGSDQIVLARSTEQDPFRFASVTALEGDADFVDIPQLVDSVTRRKLAANPDDHVLFARDGAYGPWKRVAYVDDAMGRVLADVMNNLQDWEFGGDEERFAYFASLLDHPDRDVHSLALRELDLADYGVLRSLDATVDTTRLMERLDLRYETGLKPIRILLLGFGGEPVPSQFFERGVHENSNTSGGILGAYATAMIEHGGPDAVKRLVHHHLENRALPPISREMLVEALAIHSTAGSEDTRGAIRIAIAQALDQDPDLAAMVARQFGARYDWSQGDAISRLMQRGAVRSPIDMLLLTQYVSLAREHSSAVQN